MNSIDTKEPAQKNGRQKVRKNDVNQREKRGAEAVDNSNKQISTNQVQKDGNANVAPATKEQNQADKE